MEEQQIVWVTAAPVLGSDGSGSWQCVVGRTGKSLARITALSPVENG